MTDGTIHTKTVHAKAVANTNVLQKAALCSRKKQNLKEKHRWESHTKKTIPNSIELKKTTIVRISLGLDRISGDS